MPQIRQLQLYHWGFLLADPIELQLDGVNVCVGPNGSGKTSTLDAIKLILGVAPEHLKESPAKYIFNGGGNPSLRAGRAYVKAIFNNPPRDGGRRARVFAEYGRGCERAPEVTAVCWVTKQHRRYALLPGAITWGETDTAIEEELKALHEAVAQNWMKPSEWSDLLAAAGISKALLQVVSIKQGETDQAISGSRENLLRRVLELTGKQGTVDEFKQARDEVASARAAHHQALDLYRLQERESKALRKLADRHQEYLDMEARWKTVVALELPAVTYREKEGQLAEARRSAEMRLEVVSKADARLEELEIELPDHEWSAKALERERDDTLARERDSQTRFGTASGEAASARADVTRLQDDIAAGRSLLGSDPTDSDIERTRREADAASRAAGDGETEKERLEEELAELRAGRQPRPDGLDDFRALLAEREIENALVAERLESGQAIAAEAVLGDAVWALVVGHDRYEEALALAEERGHRLPIVRAGGGAPSGVFADVTGLDGALAFLTELDRPVGNGMGQVSERGVVRGQTWGAFRAAESPALGERARQQAIARIDVRLSQLEDELPRLVLLADNLRVRAETAAAGARATAALPAAEDRLNRAEAELTEAKRELDDLTGLSAHLAERLGRVETVLEQLRREHEEIERALPRQKQDAESAGRRVSELEAELMAEQLTPEQAALETERTREQLEGEQRVLGEQLERFGEEERSPAIVAELADQEERLQRADEMVSGKRELLDRVEEVAREAKRRYDGHVKQTIDRLNASFRDMCDRAGMKGELDLRPSVTNQEEFELDARVAHNRGDAMLSFQDSAHSGGEKAKIAVLLLLAAMSSEGAADLLVMDEHTAHLDSTNIDILGGLMGALRSHVQFILATPANAEALRLDWANHELVFFSREDGEPYAPPIQILTREAEYEPPVDEHQLEITH